MSREKRKSPGPLALAGLLALAGGAALPAQVVNTCWPEIAVEWFDVPAEDRVINFPTAMYNPPCVKIYEGQTVTWNGNFGSHPLRGGLIKGLPPKPGNPIPDVDFGTDPVTVLFLEEGPWGYYCDFHQPPMAGAVFVYPFAFVDGFESGDTCAWTATTEPETCP